MCLAIPARVTAVEGGTARVDLEGNERDCSIEVVPGVEVGDFVLMHAGYAIQIISREDAEDTLRLGIT
ncbi:MAG: HypC/HybG/HupF family hydrogenase formation chaperone, partial [Bacillota bacterium]